MNNNKFNPYFNMFNTETEFSKIFGNSMDILVNKKILQSAPCSILQERELLINLGKRKKLYMLQLHQQKILAFPDDGVGGPVEITDKIYQFHIPKFLKCLANENNFTPSDDNLSKHDYVIGHLSIGGKKIIWICSFDTEGFQKYKTKSYFEDLDKQWNFILLSDCTNNIPDIKGDKLSYLSIPLNLQNFRINPQNFIKKEIGITSDEAKYYLKDKITFFIDNTIGKIYYKNRAMNIRKDCYAYKLFMALLKEPLKEHDLETIVKEKVGRSSQSDLLTDGRGYKRTLKNKLIDIHPEQKDEINIFLPDIKNGTIKLNLTKKDIFFF